MGQQNDPSFTIDDVVVACMLWGIEYGQIKIREAQGFKNYDGDRVTTTPVGSVMGNIMLAAAAAAASAACSRDFVIGAAGCPRPICLMTCTCRGLSIWPKL